MILLDATTRRAMARHGGVAVRRPLLDVVTIEDRYLIAGGCGVYVACDERDRVLYVGSVHRPADPFGVVHRLGEHLAEPDGLKELRWRRVWALMVDPGQDRRWVRDYEGVIGAELAPAWNDRLPAL